VERLRRSITLTKEIFENNNLENSFAKSERKKSKFYSKIQQMITNGKTIDLDTSPITLKKNESAKAPEISFDKECDFDPFEIDDINILRVKLKSFIQNNQMLSSENKSMKKQLNKENDSEEHNKEKQIIEDLKSIINIQKKEIKRLQTLMIEIQKGNIIFESKENNPPILNISKNTNYLNQKEIQKDDDQELNLSLNLQTDTNFLTPSRNDSLIISKLSHDNEKSLELNLDEINIGIKEENIKEKSNNIKEITIKISNTCHLPISFSLFEIYSTSSFLFY